MGKGRRGFGGGKMWAGEGLAGKMNGKAGGISGGGGVRRRGRR